MNYTSGPEDPYRSAAHTDQIQLAALKKKTDTLQKVYLALFVFSLVLIVVHRATFLWAVVLGSAVCTRLYRQSLVNKYNAIVAGGGPSTLV
jgi:hypothetical protein